MAKIKRYNQSHYEPKIPEVDDEHNHFSMKRKNFFESTEDAGDYKLKTFYGPGQKPDCGDQDGVDFIGNDVVKTYKPPNDWIKAGMSLYVPQVIFIAKKIGLPNAIAGNTSKTYWYQGVGNVGWGAGDAGGPCGGLYSDPNDQAWILVQASFSYDSTAPDHLDEEDRLDDVFTEVERIINELRPGRTWVKYWKDWNIAGDIEGSDFGMNLTMDFLLAPPITDNYFGTDFLYIYAGTGVAHGEGGFGNAMGPNPNPGGDLYDDPVFANSAERVKAAFTKFRGYESWVWVLRIDDEGVDWRSIIEPTIEEHRGYDFNVTVPSGFYPPGHSGLFPSSIKRYPHGGYFSTNPTARCAQIYAFTTHFGSLPFEENINYFIGTYPDSGVRTPMLAYCIDARCVHHGALPIEPYFDPWIAGLPIPQVLVDDQENQLQNLNNNENNQGQYIKELCDELSDYGVKFQGAITAITVQSIIAAIANHFHFDPSTGKDITD